ncbi:hypothetical protein Xoosp13_220 [Xanthomonas phage Xoo-sp13]|nr:hypothetical protein Xoosp13_220 [Xanthomonas phage Xoo-sp13]
MFIFVRTSDDVIVGYSVKPVNIEDMARQGNKVFEVDDSGFDFTMIGQSLKEFDSI